MLFEPFRKREIEIVRRFIFEEKPQDKIIVDLGAGNNPVSNSIQCKKRITVDISPDVNPDIVCDLNTGIPLKDESADVIIACQVIEHIYHSKKFIGEIKRILKLGGH